MGRYLPHRTLSQCVYGSDTKGDAPQRTLHKKLIRIQMLYAKKDRPKLDQTAVKVVTKLLTAKRNTIPICVPVAAEGEKLTQY